MAGIFMVITLIIFVCYGASASLARAYIISNPRIMLWLKRSFAATFGFLSLKLALSDR